MSDDINEYPKLKEHLVAAVAQHRHGRTEFNGEYVSGAAIPGGRRCAVAVCPWMSNWFVGTSPRNGDDATVEGTWEDWVVLAKNILAIEESLLSPAYQPAPHPRRAT